LSNMLTMRRRLTEGLSGMGVIWSDDQVERLIAFLVLMQKWTRTYNLTAIRDMPSAVDLHVLDSASVLPFLHGLRVLDVGTGAGLPGIPLAILDGSREFVLLDGSAKKIRFVRQVILELGLGNVEAVASRVQDFAPSVRFDTITSRAFASIDAFIGAASHLAAAQGRYLALKGRLPVEELSKLNGPEIRVHRLEIPGMDAERHLIEILAE